jgi:uridine phosphorylase
VKRPSTSRVQPDAIGFEAPAATPLPPLLAEKHYAEPSVFEPAALLRQARRQRRLPDGQAPAVCLLDPDGDVVRHLRGADRSRRLDSWACYHTELDVFQLGSRDVGVVGGAVGAPFAVLVAEQLAASGCELVISVTSAGRLARDARRGFMLIERAVRDEGTSYHYLAPGQEAALAPALVAALADGFGDLDVPVFAGASWTTDAPFRETQSAIDHHARAGIACVEMEAAALYAYAQSQGATVVCVAHLTNEMGRQEIDFEKGAADGATETLTVVARIADLVLPP